jgi:hypothetical protein
MTRRLVAVLALIAALPVALGAGPVKFKNTFIETFKNRVTIDVSFRVDKAHPHPNTIADNGDDGDMHVAGRATAVGLPMVVEIVNAGEPAQKAVVDRMKTKLQQPPASLSGVWRIWYEHPAASLQTQGATVPPPEHTNPKHVFEIHPVTSFDGVSALASFAPVPGYVAYAATKAFAHYEAVKLTVRRDSAFTRIASSAARYNYAEFDMVLAGPPEVVSDGVMVFANVVDSSGAMLVAEPRRMVCAAGTRPADLIRVAKAGATFRALGIPRINLARVSARAIDNQTVEIVGAYEMIIVGVIQ